MRWFYWLTLVAVVAGLYVAFFAELVDHEPGAELDEQGQPASAQTAWGGSLPPWLVSASSGGDGSASKPNGWFGKAVKTVADVFKAIF